jgi:S-DNA-T family DNA segregation ATPase FtsK/SpoIIIE
LQEQSASTSLLQRRLKIGYGRAARLLDIMHDAGIVGPPRGSKPRKVLAPTGSPGPGEDY